MSQELISIYETAQPDVLYLVVKKALIITTL